MQGLSQDAPRAQASRGKYEDVDRPVIWALIAFGAAMLYVANAIEKDINRLLEQVADLQQQCAQYERDASDTEGRLDELERRERNQ